MIKRYQNILDRYQDDLIGELRKYKDSLDARDCLFYDGEVNHITEAKFSKHFVRLFKTTWYTEILIP